MRALGLTVAALVGGAAQASPAWRDFYDDVRHERVTPEVRRFVIRAQGCGHWGGEYPYDAERLAQINAAARLLRCARLDRDRRALLRRYRDQPRVIRLLEQAYCDEDRCSGR